jgi:acetyl-CoA/propionyl-CoA carboxylase biotin carboxyl carrier protein
VEVDGRLHSVKVIGGTAPTADGAAPGRRPPKRQRSGSGGGGGGGPTLTSPLQGSVFKVVAEQGAEVEEGALICVIEAMKMENEITAHRAGKITELNVSEGAAISTGDPIATIE